MDAKEYMARKCVCGRTRGEHVHMYQRLPGLTLLRVLPLTGDAPCAGYLDEFELELQGDPRQNVHLSPLVEEELADVRIRQNGPVS
jgi:hypothetical protein